MSFWKKYRFAIIYGILLVGFTVYAALDVFVIPHPQAVVEVPVTVVDSLDSSDEKQNSSDEENKQDSSDEENKQDLQSTENKIANSKNNQSNIVPGTEKKDSAVDSNSNESDGKQSDNSSDGIKKTNEEVADNSGDRTEKVNKTETDAKNFDAKLSQNSTGSTENSTKGAENSPKGAENSTKGTENTTKGADSTKGAEDTTESAEDSRLSSESESDSSETAKTGKNNTGTIAVAHLGDFVDSRITITVNQYREYDTDIYVADVTISEPGLLKTAFADNTYGRNIKAKTSETASAHGAILAINGDFYGARETGYVIRNGVLYRSDPTPGNQDLVIYGDGSFQVVSESKTTAEELLNAGAVQVISFGPGLISGGKITVNSDTEVAVASPSNPRSAIGQISGLHYLFVCSDGRTEESAGLTLLQLAEFMQKFGVRTGYNLDGGGSSAIYFNGVLLNKPTTDGKKIVERTVSDILYIGY